MKDLLKNNILLLVVFITGAAVLVLEVAATRILSPYFGSTIYTVSSVISVILLALSVGYYVGGRLADRQGTPSLFYGIIAISGGSVFLLHLLKMLVVPTLSRMYSLQEGPLILSMLLFFLPGFLLGTLSPIVVKLQDQRLKKEGIGKIAGDVFFWSTLGSISGSLLTGFYLIPSFGVDQIIAGVGIILVVIGLLGLSANAKDSFSKLKFLVVIPFIIILQVIFLFLQSKFVSPAIIYAEDGIYGALTVYDDNYKGRPTRFFKQDLDSSSAMYLDSSELVYDYTKYYELYRLVHTSLDNALVIGAGVYSVPKALLENDKKVTVDVVDIEPSLIDVGKKYFNVPNDPRLVNYVEDGRRFLYDRDKKYNLIFGDAFHFSIPQHIATKEFFELSKSRLQPEGFFIMNVIGSLAQKQPSFALSEIRTFKEVYPNSYFFAVRDLKSDIIQNIIIVGYNSDKKLDFSKTDKLNSPFLKSAVKNIISIDPEDLSSHPIFTDNYAPTEYFISKDF